MNPRRFTLLLPMVIALVACTEHGPESPTAVRTLSPSLDREDGASQRVVAGVTGHAEYAVTATPGISEQYEITAERRADGRVTGELEIKQTRNGSEFRIHGTVVCVTTVGTLARLAARVDRSTLPVVQPGQYLIWSVMDNDVNDREQKPKQPDSSTEFFLFDSHVAQTHCDVGVDVSPFYPVKGHLEVRDPSTETKG